MNKYDPAARFIDRFRYAVRFRGPTKETEYVLTLTDEGGNEVEERGKLGRKATHVRHLLRELAEHADWHSGGECYPSMQRLASCLAVTRQTVADTSLLACGTEWLERWKHVDESGHPGRKYHYQLRIPPEVEAWLSGNGTRSSKKTRHVTSRDGCRESDEGCRVSPQSMSEKRSPHDSFPDTNSSVNPSRNSSVNPSERETENLSLPSEEEVEGLVTLARDHLSMGQDISESDRDVIQMWLRDGRTPASIERVIIGLRLAIEGGTLAGFLNPGTPVGCRALVKARWNDRHLWGIAEDWFWKGEEKSA